MDIIREIRENRESGAVRLEAEYRGRLMAYALRVCDDRDEAESAVTHALAEAMSRIETLNDPKSFFGWLCGIVKNQHNMAVRRKEHGRVVYTDELPERVVDGGSQIAGAIDSALLRDAIAELPHDLRESLMLRYFMDLPLSTIAKLLSLPVGTVKSRLHYARVVLGMRLGATVRRPAVAMLATALLLFGAIAAVVVARTGDGEAAVGGMAPDAEGSRMSAVRVVESPNSGVSNLSSDASCVMPGQSVTSATTETSTPKKEKITVKRRTTVAGTVKSMLNGIVYVGMMSLVANELYGDDPYIESSGSTGIDTGYHMKPSTRLELDFALTDADQSAQGRVFASYQQETGTGCSLYITSSKTWGVGVGSGTGSNWSGHWVDFPAGSKYYAPVDTIRHQVVYDLPNDRLVFATGSVTNWTHTTTKAPFTADAVYSLGLFAWPTTTAAMYSDPSKARIYGLKIYEADELVHDFEPCMMDGLAGFRDSVTGKFIAGGKDPGSFTAGGDYVTYESPYVATPTDNSAYYIDTEYQASANTCFMLDCAPLGTWTSGMSAWYLFYGYGSKPFSGYISGAGFGTQINGGVWDTGIVALDKLGVGVRRTFALDNFNKKSFALVAGITNGTVKAIAASAESHPANTITVKIASSFRGDQNYVPMKIYGCKIYESGELVRDFEPYVRDGYPGLRDKLTGLFVSYPTNKKREAAAALSAGGEGLLVEADPYIEGSGVNGPYIVTDYKPCGTTRAEIDFAQTAFDTAATHYPFSIHATGTAFSFGVYAFASTQTYGYNCNDGNPKWHYSGMPTQTLARTTLILDAKNGKYYAAEARGAVTNKTVNIADTRTPATRSQYYLPIFASRQNTSVSDEDGGGTNPYPAANRMPMKLYSFRLFENDVLVRDYVPAVKDGVAGLQDRLPGGKFLAPATGVFTYGGAFPVEVEQSVSKIAHGETATLTASAPGATSYRWLKNGEPIAGGANGTLTVEWRRPGRSPVDVYQAVAIFTTDGLDAESAASDEIAVENKSTGFLMIIM